MASRMRPSAAGRQAPTDRTQLQGFPARLCESCWLAAVITIPVLFNPYGASGFEADKIALLGSLAVPVIGALALGLALPSAGTRPWWRLPLVAPALSLLAIQMLATAFSVAPHISWWGFHERRQGTFYVASLIAVFLGLVIFLRRRIQLERLVDGLLIASLPVSLYAILQHFDMDPIGWPAAIPHRVSAQLGNPIFLGAYLILVVPMTWTRVIGFAAGWRRAAAGARGRWALLGAAAALLLESQLLAIYFAQSRGPLLALVGELWFFALLWAAVGGRRRVALAVLAAAAAGAAWWVVLGIDRPAAPKPGPSAADHRLTRVFDLEQTTAKVRILIWEGALDLMAAHPGRLLLGFGPETMQLVYPPHYRPELAHLESGYKIPDRSHNDTLDALVTTGVLGLAARLAVYLSLWHFLLGCLRLTGRGRSWLFWSLAALGGSAGAGLPYLCEGSLRFSALGLAAGMVAALALYLLIAAWSWPPRQTIRGDRLLQIALFATVVGHFLEIQVGIGIAATQLYFWACAGIAVAVGIRSIEPESQELDRSPYASPRPATAGAAHGLLVALLISVIGFELFALPARPAGQPLVVAGLLVAVWSFGALLVLKPSQAGGPCGRLLLPLGVYTATTLAIAGLFHGLYLTSLPARPLPAATPSEAVALGARLACSLTILYLFVFSVVFLLAALLRREAPRPAAQPVWIKPALVAVLLAAAFFVAAVELPVSQAEVYAKLGDDFAAAGRWPTAVPLYRQALELQPESGRYLFQLGQGLIQQAVHTRSEVETHANLQRALQVIRRAQRLSPREMDHLRSRTLLHRVWASRMRDPAEQRRQLALAERFFGASVDHSPQRIELRNQWALFQLQWGRPRQAALTLEEARKRDRNHPVTHLLLGHAYVAQQAWPAALRAYERALQLNPRLAEAHSGLAFVYARQGRNDLGIAAARRAVQIDPHHAANHLQLADLLAQKGDLTSAIEAARSALLRAPPGERPAIERFLQQLRQRAAGP